MAMTLALVSSSSSCAPMGSRVYLGLERRANLRVSKGVKAAELVNPGNPPLQEARSWQIQTLNAQHLSLRREAIVCMGTSFLTILLQPVESVEARTVNPDVRKKIFEKLEHLREKAGLRKEKKGEESSNEGKGTPATPREKAQEGQSGRLVVETGFSG